MTLHQLKKPASHNNKIINSEEWTTEFINFSYSSKTIDYFKPRFDFLIVELPEKDSKYSSKKEKLPKDVDKLVNNFEKFCNNENRLKIKKRLNYLMEDLQSEDENINYESIKTFIEFNNYFPNCEYPDIMIDGDNNIHCEWRTDNNKNVLILVCKTIDSINYLIKRIKGTKSLHTTGEEDLINLYSILKVYPEIKKFILP